MKGYVFIILLLLFLNCEFAFLAPSFDGFHVIGYVGLAQCVHPTGGFVTLQ